MNGCPRPDKIAYRTRIEADRALVGLGRKGRADGLSVYPCHGHWHHGHVPTTHIWIKPSRRGRNRRAA